jgi:hypothetical protein
MAVLLIRPETDAVEQVLSGVALHALSVTPPRPDIQSLQPQLPAAPLIVYQPLTRATVDQAISAAAQPVHLLYFGHARRDRLGDPTTLVDVATLPYLKDSFVLALACSSSDQLGPGAVRAGVRTWIGFTRPILVPLMPWMAANLTPFDVAAVTALNGAPASDVVKQTRDTFEHLADNILNLASAAAYTQAVIDSHVQRGISSTFRADGDQTATL